ncbi:MAG: hypothetical protein GKR94_20185 [Gammaproteobacteria bacterium]|nr:hypothetical protein [Gammaproteobacteria bacterium]
MFAVAEFGSTCRQSSDSHSDKDLLIIGDRELSKRLANRYKQQGYSVSTLTQSQLVRMQHRGSLFIQHLRTEAHVQLDVDSAFSRWIQTCEYSPPTIAELWRCRNTIKLIDQWPRDSALEGWRSDFLYCVSRDFLIKWLARRGVLAFGLEDIERGLGGENNGLAANIGDLALLREAKAAYRDGQPVPNGAGEAMEEWCAALRSFLKLPEPPRAPPSLDKYIAGLSRRQFSSNYERLRSLEGAYKIATSRGMQHPSHDLLTCHILQPNGYGSSQARKAAQMYAYLCDVLNLIANKPLNPTAYPLRGCAAG